jgi:Subtilase family
VSPGFPRRAQAGVAAGFAAVCLAMSVAAPAAATSVRSQEWWLGGLHVTQAWQSTHGAGVTVAVLDTGVDPKQADLAGSVITGPDYTKSGRREGGQFWGIHGTAMASLIAGHGHGPSRSEGMLGTAPAAHILSVRVTLESTDPMLADPSIAAGLPGAIARGIRYAVGHGAAVIDLPLDPVTTPGAPGAGGSRAERAAVEFALDHRVVLVAPAGDSTGGAGPVNYPAAYPGVISVGAFNAAFMKAPFSSHQPYVTLTAAGDGVSVADGPTGYVQISSTSAASAVVAGIVALIRAQFPGLDPAQVTKALTESTRFGRPGGRRDGSGAGTVDAAAALLAAAHMANATSASGSPATGNPPNPPAVHTSTSMRRTLLIDAGIALAAFLLAAVPILGYGRWRRRRARAARLAEVRAAAQPAARRPRPDAPVTAGTGRDNSYIPAPVGPGLPTAAPPGNGVRTGSRAPWDDESLDPGSAFTGHAFTGNAPPGTVTPRGAPGSAPPGTVAPGGAFPGSSFPGGGVPGSGFSGGSFTDSLAPGGGLPGGSPASGGIPGSGFSGGSFTDSVAPGGGSPGSGFSGSALPRTGYQGAPGAPAEHAGMNGPPGPPRPAGQPGATNGLAGMTRPPGAPGMTGPPGPPRPAGRPGASGPAVPGVPGGQAIAGGRRAQPGPVPGGPASEAPASGPGPDHGAGAPGGSAPGEDTAAGPGSAAAGGAAGRLIGSHRGGAARPKISGRPPWDPAPEPPGEVPWAQPPAPPAGGARMLPPGPPSALGAPLPAPTPEPLPWDAIAEEAWPGGPASSRSLDPPPPGASPGHGLRGGHDSGSDPYEDSEVSGPRPIFVWNPGASAESFPDDPPGENHKR